MLFEALTGRVPFVGQAHEMLVDKQRRAAPRLSASDAPGDLAALCVDRDVRVGQSHSTSCTNSIVVDVLELHALARQRS